MSLDFAVDEFTYQINQPYQSVKSLMKEWDFRNSPVFALVVSIYSTRSYPLTVSEIREILMKSGIMVYPRNLLIVLEGLSGRGVLTKSPKK